jgi:hypothetical protein
MESAAREMNLTDVAQRLEKIIVEARQIQMRMEDAGDIVRGQRPAEETAKSNCPEPSGLVPLLTTRLGVLESIQYDQRQSLNRLVEGLHEAPPGPPISTPLSNLRAAAADKAWR